jgi:hypothetical protein
MNERIVVYHSDEWLRLSRTGWVTMHLEKPTGCEETLAVLVPWDAYIERQFHVLTSNALDSRGNCP